MNITQLDQQLRSNKVSPVYLTAGSESFLRDSAIDRIAKTMSIQPSRLDTARTSAGEVAAAAASMDLFNSRQLIVAGDISEWKGDECDALLAYLTSPNPTTTLILWAEKLDQRTKLAKALSDTAAFVECKQLYANQIPEWVRIECQRQGRDISREAARLLADAVGTSLNTVSQAIGKVILFTDGRRLINVEDVEAVVLETSQRTIFDFLNAVGCKDLRLAFSHLNKLLAFGESPILVCVMLARHWRLLLRAQECIATGRTDLAAALKVSPFFAKDYATQAANFSLQLLKNGFKTLTGLDKKLKRSRVAPVSILSNAIRQMAV